MTRVLATVADVGKRCPSCNSPITEGLAEYCERCGALHHADCWRKRPGCAAPGCSQGAAATTASLSPVVPLGPRPPASSGAAGTEAAPAPARPYPGPSSPPIQTTPEAWKQPAKATTTSSASHATVVHGHLNRTVLFVVLAIVVLGAGGGVVAAAGVLSSGAPRSRHPPRRTAQVSRPTPVPTSVGPTAHEQTSDRGEILSLLNRYQSAYSAHDAPALAKLFSTQIVRHGLAAGGCTVSHGRSAVLADYESQFQDGSGSYLLVGLAAEQVQFDSKTQAHLDGHYRITPGGSGYVNFRFVDTGEGWKISEVDATCA